jgi:PAS domain S-box-containing protein
MTHAHFSIDTNDLGARMDNTLRNHPALEKFIVRYPRGRKIFLEGDDSQDLYILVSGQVEVLKGEKILAEIVEEGAPFGEMSFLMQAPRTATARARSDVTAIRIPKDAITEFLVDFPTVSGEITRRLAIRLHETTRVLHGFKEFSDQIPDSVILTDSKGRIISWNDAAEELHGRAPEEMRHQPVDEIFRDPQEFTALLEELKSTGQVKERMLRIVDAQGQTRFISTSSTILRDAHGAFQGVLYLSRDVSTVEKLRQQYRKARSRLLPMGLAAVVLALALIFGYPYFFRGIQAGDVQKQALHTQLAKDFVLLKSLLLPYYRDRQPESLAPLLEEFLHLQEQGVSLYRGLLLLDAEKHVFNACSADPLLDTAAMIGSSYSGVDFQGDEDSLHRVLVLYRTDKENPMGRKGIEVAFQVFQAERFLGWLLFQLDPEILERDFGLDEQGLLDYRFPRT